jgi:hypothetical protein
VLLPTRRVTQTLAEVDGDWQPAVRVSQMLVEVDMEEIEGIPALFMHYQRLRRAL